MLGKNYHPFVRKRVCAFAVFLAMTTLFLFSCARYMGYESEVILKTEEAKEVRTPLGEAQTGIKDIRFYPGGKISAKVERVQTFSVARVTPRVEKRTAYYAGWDSLMDLFMLKAWLGAPIYAVASVILAVEHRDANVLCFNPGIDLFVRVCGGKGFDGVRKHNTEPFLSVPRYRRHPPGYWSRLYHWTAWVNPFYAWGPRQQTTEQISEKEVRTVYFPMLKTKSLPEILLEPESKTINSNELVATALPCEKVVFELGGKEYDGKQDYSGQWWVDVSNILPTLARSDEVNAIVIAQAKGERFHAKGKAQASELGVTWAVPKVLPGRPPGLDVVLALGDSDGNGILGPGESAKAKLAVRNTGNVSAWDLRTNWNTPHSALDVLKVSKPTATTYGRLDPGQSWETSVDMQAAPEWAWEGAITVTAKVEDASKTAHPEAHATLATRSFDPPRLALAHFAWTDFEDGILQPGDKVTLRLWVQNTGPSEARGVYPVLRSSDQNLVLGESIRKRVVLEPSRLEQFEWRLEIPETWSPTDANASGQLPIDYVIREERTRYWTMTRPLGLALGARAEGVTTVQEATELAALQEGAKEAIAAEREMKNLQAQLDKRRRDADLLKQKLAEEVAAEELKLADEIDKIRSEAEARKRQFEQQQEELKRKYGEETETYQQEQAKIEAILKKQQEAELARLTELERRHKILEEQRKLEQSELYQLRKRSYAVIVGINKYDDPNIGELKYAVTDAKSLA